jgi:hypothetical protein
VTVGAASAATVGAALAATLFASAALAADGGLQQCAALQDPAARLACYDQAQQRPGEPPTDPASPAPTAMPEPATAPAAAAPPAGKPEDRFGLPEAGAESMTAHIDGKFIEWKRGTLIRLDNGQVWKCMEEKSAYYPGTPDNAEVEITRGMLGYRMEIKAIKRRLYVRRVS